MSKLLLRTFAATLVGTLPPLALAQTGAGPAADSPAAVAIELPATGDFPAKTLAVEHVERGQKGYGLSVFAGQEPERFEVEVIGVWRNASPELSYVLARLSGKDLERSGVLQGMSGSPVFIDEKLVGAVSFSFPFGLDPIAGITPIESMRSLAKAGGGLVVPPVTAPARSETSAQGAGRMAVGPGLVPDFTQMVARRFDPALLERHLELLIPRQAHAEGRSTLMWTAAGFGDQARQWLASRLGNLAPSSTIPMSGPAAMANMSAGTGLRGAGERGESADWVAEPDLGPGDAVALALVRGDLSLAAHGTVTDRVGESIVAFGHPVYGLGPIRLPMTESEVITTIPSVSTSFKLSNAGRLIGVFDQDRESGAHGVLGARPDLVPMQVHLRGLEDRDYRMELADAALFKPTLIGITAFGALNSGSFASGFQGLDIQARLRLEGHDDLTLEQSFDGNQAASNAIVYLLTFAAFLELNDLQPTSVKGVDVTIVQAAEPRLETLVGVRADKRRVAPGETVDLWLEVQPYRGEKQRRQVQVKLPPDLDEGRYYLMVGDGTSMDAARLAVEKRQAETFEQQLEALRSFHSRKQLHVIGLAPAKGRSLAGDVLPDLPPSLRAVYGGEGSALHLRIVDEHIEPLEKPLEGIHRVDLQIHRPPA